MTDTDVIPGDAPVACQEYVDKRRAAFRTDAVYDATAARTRLIDAARFIPRLSDTGPCPPIDLAIEQMIVAAVRYVRARDRAESLE